MALAPAITDREFQKFKDVSGETAVRVAIVEGGGGGGGSSDVNVINTPDVNVVNTPNVIVTSIPDLSVTNLVDVNLVENQKQTMLKDPLLERSFTWLDFGTKNQRISQIVYTSTNLLYTLTRSFSYTLVGTKYRLDTDVWSVV